MALMATRLCRSSKLVPAFSRALYLSPRNGVKIIPQCAEAPLELGHDEKNAKLGRPQSPHLTIYSYQLTAVLSITHRFTGIALTGYAFALGAVPVIMQDHFPKILDHLQGIDSSIILAAKALIAFPMAYHYVNGIRHLIWDSGKALTIKGVYTTGYIMLAVSLALTAFLLSL